MGKQKSSKSTSYSGSSNPAFLPYAKTAIGEIQSTYNTMQPVVNDAIDRTKAIGGGLYSDYTAGQEQAGMARSHYGDLISGRYLKGNPQLQAMVDQMREGVGGQVDSRFNLSGRYGSGAHQGVLAKELANAENQLRFNDYNFQSGRMDQAAQGALGSNAASAQQALAATALQGELPWSGMNAYGNSLGALFNGGTQKSTTYSPNPIWGAVGAGLGALGSYLGRPGASDIRLKKNVVEVGERPDGLKIYNWVYRNDPDNQVQTGFMAHEVKELYPQAYIEDFDGLGHAGVDYGKIPHMELA